MQQSPQVQLQSRREPIPRGMSYPVRAGQLSAALAIAGDKPVLLSLTFFNAIKNFSGPVRDNRAPLRAQLLQASHDHRLIDLSRVLASASQHGAMEHSYSISAFVHSIPTWALRECREACAGAIAEIGRLSAGGMLVQGNPAEWRISLQLDTAARTCELCLDHRPVREWEPMARRVIAQTAARP